MAFSVLTQLFEQKSSDIGKAGIFRYGISEPLSNF